MGSCNPKTRKQTVKTVNMKNPNLIIYIPKIYKSEVADIYNHLSGKVHGFNRGMIAFLKNPL